MDENAVLNAEAENLNFFLALVGIDENPVVGFFLLYIIITILNIVVFHLGFARKLPLIKNIIVHAALIFGSVILTILAIFGLPIAEVLVIASAVLIIYKIRLHQTKKKESSSNSN